MAHQRTQSLGEGLHKAPHTVSLKVLRLSRPSLAMQHPITNLEISSQATKDLLAYPSAKANEPFILTPYLVLPEAFGQAYVGETFSCTLCANNELKPGDKTRIISGVKIQGDMQTPSTPSGAPLDLAGPEGDCDSDDMQGSPGPGESLQKRIRFELKEEGNHVLAVTVTYTETAISEDGKAASGGRVRTFRKLYQFVAQQLLSVRTKTGQLLESGGVKRCLLEAQLENMGERDVILEAVTVNPKPPFTSQSLNWDMDLQDAAPARAPILKPRDVIQVAFLLEQESGAAEETDASGKTQLGQVAIQWRSALGDRGQLCTGWLSTRR